MKKEILTLGGMVEQAINTAISSLNNRQPELAEEVLANESEIDEKEVTIEEDCLKILALHQPVAIDLRFIVVVLKVNNDLERMGDFAVNIAKRSLVLSQLDPLPVLPEFVETMPNLVRTMVHDALDSLVKMDVDLAEKVMGMDDQVDEINRKMYDDLQKIISKDQTTVERALNIMSTSRYLERIADLSTNIAEDVVFMSKGTVIRHADAP